jgi:phosphoribosylaminoimidazolecarboxamide formyltransferase/IMP cyclohydrolase
VTESTHRQPLRRALVSVFDKAGLDRLAAALAGANVEVVSTGSTAAALEGHGLAVTRVEQLTGFPEMLEGRVKTLHPRVHAALLADRRQAAHVEQLNAAGIAPFDLLVVNLYPFEETIAGLDPSGGPAATEALAIERIDVGGPAMLRAASKNFASLAVICDPADYGLVETALAAGGTTLEERRALAAKAFARTAAYDAAVAGWFAATAPAPEARGPAAVSPPDKDQDRQFPERLTLTGRLRQRLRYGENPHQAAAFYGLEDRPGWGLAAAVQLAGKELSYNNLLDADAVLALVAEHADRPFAAIVKHTNPCGAAFADRLEDAYAAALEGDPVSAFGGVVGLSRPLDAATATRIAGIFTEVVLAPAFEQEAMAVLAGKPSLRLLQVDLRRPEGVRQVRSVAGGLLAQDADHPADDPATWNQVAGDPPGEATLADLALAWSVAGHVKSNAIVLAREGRVVGVGAGQQSRVDSVRIAVAKAGGRAHGAVAGSDAFFPFPDGVEALAEAGVRAIAHPGGSVRDDQATAAAATAGVAMFHTGRRHFRH